MKRLGIVASLGIVMVSSGVLAHRGSANAPPAVAPDLAEFRALYKELVETNTTFSVGNCTEAAAKMAARLKAAGYPEADLHPFQAEGHPKEGGLVAVLRGKESKARPMLLLAHIDVVEAKREDWQRDPFILIEENGYFYGRGTLDDKAQAAVWVDILIRLKAGGFRPRRDIKMALTCGEEGARVWNGAQYLATHERALIDAEFALNEGAGGHLDANGKPIALNIEAGEKSPRDYQLEVTNPGGHSSRPTPNNAIYHLAAALTHISEYEFPIELTDASRTFFVRMAPIVGGEMGAAMTAFAKDPRDAKAAAIVKSNPEYNGMIHTTCVATMVEAGHSTNALPQRARANINCRIFPGATDDQVRATLIKEIGDPEVKVESLFARAVAAPPPPLTPEIMGPIEKVAHHLWPGIPVIPLLESGAGDGMFLGPIGIPTYGVTGFFEDPDGNGMHGLNERLRVTSLYNGRAFLYELVKIYAMQK